MACFLLPLAAPSHTAYTFRHSGLHIQAPSTQISDKQLSLGHFLSLGVCATTCLLSEPREKGLESGLGEVFWGPRYQDGLERQRVHPLDPAPHGQGRGWRTGAGLLKWESRALTFTLLQWHFSGHTLGARATEGAH